MQKNRKRIFTWILLFTVSIQVFWWDGISVSAEPAAIEAPSAVLLESSTGKVIFEQNARERRSPASITKIMTLLLTFEALDQGKIKLEDPVTVSAYASSMGGSRYPGGERGTDLGDHDQMYCCSFWQRCQCGGGRIHSGE